ncbi:hypothetical protein C1Y40_05339 [Mycobacterium talmoniae]|uniref:Uncharacterized protein n=1 Tax=Mycobacterium talmoniae TaxID=1858794 RepID=A0A2S8BCX4_9MYCO|nr:hypothetical protein C1Y40_05339 [Mycobacterium talmoniae]
MISRRATFSSTPNRSRATLASACLTTFCRHSCAIRYSASSMCSGNRMSASSNSRFSCGMERARLASPPAKPRSSSTGGRSPLIAARASANVNRTSSRASSSCWEASAGSSPTARAAASSRYDRVISRCEIPS